jgi:hypothetical protein
MDHDSSPGLAPESAALITYTYQADPPRPRFDFEHDREKRLFVVSLPDGTVERFRADPVRYLVVEPDHETGELRPVTRHGLPSYVWLCREDWDGG